VAIAASGGKDSTVLAHVLTELNRRHNYGLDLFLLSIDEGITGYRDDSLETVKRNEIQVKSRCFLTLMKSELFFVTSNHVCMSLLN
jgi:tRNA(Ile)-lysidine synthase TilS/MesJ